MSRVPSPLPTASLAVLAWTAFGGLCALTPGCGNADSPDGSQAAQSTASAVEKRPLWSLPAAEREYIWGLEHSGNLLVRHGFGALREALDIADAAAIRELASDDFSGTTPDDPAVTVLDRSVVHAEQSSGAGATRDLTADGLVAFLLEQRARFDTFERASLGVMKIGPAERSRTDGSWEVRARLDLVGRTGTGRVQVRMQVDLEIVEPTEAALLAPGWLRGFHLRRLDWAESHDVLFEPVTGEIGIATAALHDNWTATSTHNMTGGVYACDYNRDGCTDLLVMDVNSDANRLLAGCPEGTFEDATASMGLADLRGVKPRNGHATVVDLDGDGWEDMIAPSGEIWRNREGRGFERREQSSNFFEMTGGSSGFQHAVDAITVADYDCDGLLDLYVHRLRPNPDSWLKETSDSPIRNQLLRNLGDWRFEDVTHPTGTAGEQRAAFTSVWFHANDDRWPDLYLPHEFGDGVLYVNVEGRRFEARDVSGRKRDFGTMGAVAGDVDGDGRMDLYLAEMYSKAGQRIMNNLPDDAYPADVTERFRSLVDGSELYLNGADGAFTATGAESLVNDIGWAYGPSLADFDNDGRLDLYAPCGYISRDRTKPDG